MDIVERLRDTGDHARFEPSLHHEAADEIERLREALRQIEYLDRPQVRGLPRRVSIHDIARAALGEEK
jgi:hypothetical protein